MKTLLIFIVSIFLTFKLPAQKNGQALIDSLLISLKTEKTDTNRVNQLNLITHEFCQINADTALILGFQALNLSQKLNWENGIGNSNHAIGYAYYGLGKNNQALNHFKKAIKVWDQLLIKNKSGELTEADHEKIIKKKKSSTLGHIGLVYSAISEHDTALQYYFQSLNLAKETDDNYLISKQLLNIGSIYIELGEFNKSIDYFFSALKLNNVLKNKESLINNLSKLGIAYMYKGEFNKSLDYFFQALKLSEEIDNKNLIASQQGNIGLIYKRQGDFEKALEYFERVLKTFTTIGNKIKIATALTNIGSVYEKQGNYAKAIDNYFNSLKIAEELGNKIIASRQLTNIGIIYSKHTDYPKAIEYFNRALKSNEELGNKHGILTTLMNIGVCYAEQKDYIKSLEIYFKALKLNEQLGDKDIGCDLLGNIGNIYKNQYNNKEAISYYLRALQLANETGNKLSIATWLGNIGSVYTSEKKFNKAENYLQKAVKLSDSIGDLEGTKTFNQHLSELYWETGNYKKALESYKKATQAKDSLFNEEKDKEITRKAMTYEFEKKEAVTRLEAEKKEQQINYLKKESQLKADIAKKENQKKNYAISGMVVLLIVGSYTYFLYDKRKKLSNQLSESLLDLKQMQNKLIQTEKEKEAENIRLRISRDIHDDIGHNLTKIALLSGLSSSDRNITSPDTKETLNRIGEYSRQVNSSLSEIVWAISPKQDNLESLLVYMRSHIHKFFENTNIKYQINFPESIEFRSINPNLKRNIFLVLKESLNNILKYADAKNVTIHFVIAESTFSLTVKDDGRGFEFSSVLQTSSGIQNMKYRMEQRNGNFQIITSPGNGCEIIANGVFET